MEKKSNSRFIIAVALFLPLILIIITISFYRSHLGVQFSNIAGEWGLFGDYFGGILNPIFGYLTFMGLIYTIYLQRIEINNNYKELNQYEIQRKKEEILQILEIIVNKIEPIVQIYPVKIGQMPKFDHIFDSNRPIYFKINKLYCELLEYVSKLEMIDKESFYVNFYKEKFVHDVVQLIQDGYLEDVKGIALKWSEKHK